MWLWRLWRPLQSLPGFQLQEILFILIRDGHREALLIDFILDHLLEQVPRASLPVVECLDVVDRLWWKLQQTKKTKKKTDSAQIIVLIIITTRANIIHYQALIMKGEIKKGIPGGRDKKTYQLEHRSTMFLMCLHLGFQFSDIFLQSPKLVRLLRMWTQGHGWLRCCPFKEGDLISWR